MTDTTTVDYAKPADHDGIMALLRLMHAEQSMFSLDERKVGDVVARCVNNDRGIGGVVRVDGQPVAAMGMLVESMWWTSDLCLIEQFNFVHPDHRRSHYASGLIDFAKGCSDRMKDMKLPLVIGVFDVRKGNGKTRTEGKLRFYRRKLEEAGAFFGHNMELVDQHVR